LISDRSALVAPESGLDPRRISTCRARSSTSPHGRTGFVAREDRTSGVEGSLLSVGGSRSDRREERFHGAANTLSGAAMSILWTDKSDHDRRVDRSCRGSGAMIPGQGSRSCGDQVQILGTTGAGWPTGKAMVTGDRTRSVARRDRSWQATGSRVASNKSGSPDPGERSCRSTGSIHRDDMSGPSDRGSDHRDDLAPQPRQLSPKRRSDARGRADVDLVRSMPHFGLWSWIVRQTATPGHFHLRGES
jgi:hypothetical protein